MHKAEPTDEATLYNAVEIVDEAIRQIGHIVADARHVRTEARVIREPSYTDADAAGTLRIMSPYLEQVADRLFDQSALALESLLTAREEVLDVWRRKQRATSVRLEPGGAT